MKRRFMTPIAAVFVAAGCASVGASDELSEKAAARLADFEPTGETSSCLSTTRIRSIDPLDDTYFLIRATGGDYYLNKISGRCNGADRASNRLQYEMSTTQLCQNQIITVVDNSSGFTVGSCGLGAFEKLAEKPAE